MFYFPLCAEYLRTQASLWSLDGPGIAKESNKQAFREQRVASIVLPTDRRVGLDLFGTPPLAQAWALKATWGEEHVVLYRVLSLKAGAVPPSYTSNSYSGTLTSLRARGFVLEPLPNAVYCVPFQSARECDGVAKYLTHLLGDAKILTPPRKGPAPRVDPSFEHKAGIQQAPQGLRLLPVRAGQLTSESAIEVDSPGNSPVPAGSVCTSMAAVPKADVPAQRSRTDSGEPGVGTLRAGRWSTPWLKPSPMVRWRFVSPPPPSRRDASRTPCGTPRKAREPRGFMSWPCPLTGRLGTGSGLGVAPPIGRS